MRPPADGNRSPPLRRQWAAVVLLVTLFTLLSTDPNHSLTEAAVGLPFDLAFWAIPMFVLTRYGLPAAVLMFALSFIPVYPDLTTWYAGCALLPLLARIGLVVYGFHISRAGRPCLGEAVLAG